jgi:hypothetical protein
LSGTRGARRTASRVSPPDGSSRTPSPTTCCAPPWSGNSRSSAKPSRPCAGPTLRWRTIPDLSRIVAFRDVLIHGTATLDDRLVRGVAGADLAPLRRVPEHLLPEDGEDAAGPHRPPDRA